MHLPQELVFEFARLGVVYIHLIACCVAIGLVLTSDIAMVRQLFAGESSDRAHMRHMEELQATVVWALAALWISGLAVVALDASSKGWQYFANPKLQAKILIVVLLTLNGVVLHHLVLPWLQKAGSLFGLSAGQRMFAVFAGAVSGVSWLYAAMLGVGRPLSWKYSLMELMIAYPLLISGGFMSMLLLTALGRHRSIAHSQEFTASALGAQGVVAAA